MINKINKIIMRTYLRNRNINNLGLINYLRYKLYNNKVINLTYYGNLFSIRAKTTDMSAIIPYMLEEFSILSTLLSVDYDGFIIDAGAYIGSSAIVLSKMYPKARVLAIEPNEENYRMLELNTKNYSNITCYFGALRSSSTKKSNLYNRKTGLMGYTVEKNPLDQLNPDLVQEIDSYTIEQLTNNQIPGLIKLDIEGAEAELFRESDILKSVEFVFVELHDRIIPDCSELFWKFSNKRLVIKDSGEKFLSIKKC